MNFQSIRLKPQKEKALSNYHPWIFSGAIQKLPLGLKVGDIVLIESYEQKPLAYAHYCGNNSLLARVFSFDTNIKINDSFWYEKFSKALLLRKSLNLPNNNTNGFRFLHGEGDGFSGLVCDIFDDAAFVKVTNPGFLQILELLKVFLQKELNIKDFYIEDDFFAQKVFLENSFKFVSYLGKGQKTGHFLDQRLNRLLLQNYVKDKHVLDAFCYSGGFSVYALLAQAASVTSLDISKQALEQCLKNVSLNSPYKGQHKVIEQDCFDYVRSLIKKQFDVIILDPPAFTKTSSCVNKAAKGYKDINLWALKSLENGILFTFSCSQHISRDLFQKIIFAAAKDAQKDVKILHELSQSPDHPTSIFCPQSMYLKGLVLYVD